MWKKKKKKVSGMHLMQINYKFARSNLRKLEGNIYVQKMLRYEGIMLRV